MLQSFNDRLKGPFTWIVVISISFIFVISGMSLFFTSMGGSRSYIAKVGDNEISLQQFQQYAQQATTKQQKRQVLDQMINQYLILSDAQQHNIVVSKLTLQSAIFTNPMFFDKDGKFSSEKLKQVAQYLGGMSKLEQIISQNIETSLIPKTITDTSFITTYENQTLASIYSVDKNINYIKISPDELKVSIKPTQVDLEQYYNQHRSKYVNPAQKSIGYYLVSKDSFFVKNSVNKEQIKEYYDTHNDLFNSFDDKTKETIKKIIQNRQALEQFNLFTQGVDSVKFNKLESKLGKDKIVSILDNTDKTVENIKNSLFFVNSNRYASIPISDNKVLVYQVSSSKKATPQKFDEVKAIVKESFVEQKSKELAIKKSQKLLKQLRNKKVNQDFSKAIISNDSTNFSKKFNKYVMFNSNDEYHSYQTQSGDIYIYKVIKVEPKTDSENQIPSQALNAYKEAELDFYLQVLKRNITITVNYKNI